MSKILIVEDEASISRFVDLELRHEGYETECIDDGRQALDRIEQGGVDLVVLDIMLPGLNGLEVLRRIRKEGNLVPVIMLTARDSVMDKVSGLDMGANDYLTKPFAIEELLARIRALLRDMNTESTAGSSDTLVYEDIVIDTAKHTVTCNSVPVELTVKEFDLLKALVENRSVVLTRENLLESVWGYDYFGETNVVDVYIRYLRSKLEQVSDKKYIQTVRGVGYKVG
ncbi:MAG: response regulator transcription factor [Oscillospiraceae bacterium]|nr:response regulator transcription factor [Oscillospiraceae bacterium]MBQ9209185.1 response regulator transcription factor [Oscillospiraceae bacterium]MBR4346465.1 response regulator transcription factor [Oscillospiraceae bacterium]